MVVVLHYIMLLYNVASQLQKGLAPRLHVPGYILLDSNDNVDRDLSRLGFDFLIFSVFKEFKSMEGFPLTIFFFEFQTSHIKPVYSKYKALCCVQHASHPTLLHRHHE